MLCRMLILGVVFVSMALGTSHAQDNPVVVMETSLGNIEIELFQNEAPLSVENFLAYVNSGFYEDTVFHRVIQRFMIQGGGMTASCSTTTSGISCDLVRKETRAPIKNEATNGLSNERGTVAMARTNIVDSATSQFFINTADNGNRGLDHRGTDPQSYGYAVFGRVIDGMDVVDEIAAVQTSTGDVPVDIVLIQKVAVQ